jgi:hypothetical protein
VIRTLGAQLGTDNTTRYLSFVLSPVQTDGFGGLFLDSPNFTNVFIGKTSTSKKYGLSNDVTGGLLGGAQYSGVDATSGKATLLVVKLQFVNGKDTISLFVNPTPGEAEPAVPDAIKKDLDFVAGQYMLEFISNREWGLDEIRIGTTFADVTPKAAERGETVPEPSSILLLCTGVSGWLVVRWRRRNKLARMVLLLGVVTGALIPTTASASLLIPNGNPTADKTSNRSSNGFIVTLTPSPASYRIKADCPWPIPALNAQGINDTNKWNVVPVVLNGDLQLDVYRPWVDTKPALKDGAFDLRAQNKAGFGGANFALTYKPKGSDPTGASVHWIQVIHTNNATAAEKKYGFDEHNGYIDFIDDLYPSQPGLDNKPFRPFYDNGNKGYFADATTFTDRANESLKAGIDTEFQAFLVSTVTNPDGTTTLKIYDGVWWGYQAAAAANRGEPVPEPSTWLLFGTGIGGLWAVRRRRGRHKAISVGVSTPASNQTPYD